jgi:uncharacterized protein (DUF58 family)
MSVAKDDDVFLVRQFYAETAPRVIIVVDRRASMGLYPASLPWLSKPDVVREATTAILASAHAARAYVGYLDFSSGPEGARGQPHWISPHRQGAAQIVRRFDCGFNAPGDSLELAIDYLLGLRSDVPSGTFVFVLSDFLAPGSDHVWSRAHAHGWDLIPVIIQDPVWEQSFPLIQGFLVPIADPESGDVAAVRLTAREARARQSSNAERLERLVGRFRKLHYDSVVLDTADPVAIDSAFVDWAARRRLARRRAR